MSINTNAYLRVLPERVTRGDGLFDFPGLA